MTSFPSNFDITEFSTNLQQNSYLPAEVLVQHDLPHGEPHLVPVLGAGPGPRDAVRAARHRHVAGTHASGGRKQSKYCKVKTVYGKAVWCCASLLSEAVRGGDEDDGVAAEQHGAAAVEGVVRPQQRALTRGLVTLRVTA